MDCNSYSYINYSSNIDILAEYETPDGDIITLSHNVNYFQDRFYTVSTILDDNICFDMEYCDILPNYPNEKDAREKAINYYNALVPEGFKFKDM